MRGLRRLCLLLVVPVAACTVVVGGTPVAPPIEQRGPKGSVPAGLERFYSQALTWESCTPFAHDQESKEAFTTRDAECARLTVPLAYAKPDGREITVGLLRIPAADRERRVGALVLNPGGPGGSGMTAAASMAKRNKDSEVIKRFDLVGFDPRGVGASEPRISCRTDAEWDAERLEPVAQNTPQDVEREETENSELAIQCSRRSGLDTLANVGTRDVVKDMDVLRSALGEVKLTYLGFSYGTRIGTAYAEGFPRNVRAMVLDGAIDPQADPTAEAIGQIKGFSQAFDKFVAWCVKQDECALGTSEADAEQELTKLADRIKDKPLDIGDRKLSYSDIGTAVGQSLYSEQLWDPLNRGLADFANGDGEILLKIADIYLGRGEDGVYAGTFDALTAILCVDEPRITDRAAVAEQNRKVIEAVGEDALPLNGEPPLPALDVCAFWPVPVTSEPHTPNVAGLPPVLVISTTGDPATPYQAGVNLARTLGGRLLTYEATQHTAFLQDNKCVDDAGARYLVDLTLPAEGTRCAP